MHMGDISSKSISLWRRVETCRGRRPWAWQKTCLCRRNGAENALAVRRCWPSAAKRGMRRWRRPRMSFIRFSSDLLKISFGFSSFVDEIEFKFSIWCQDCQIQQLLCSLRISGGFVQEERASFSSFFSFLFFSFLFFSWFKSLRCLWIAWETFGASERRPCWCETSSAPRAERRWRSWDISGFQHQEWLTLVEASVLSSKEHVN